VYDRRRGGDSYDRDRDRRRERRDGDDRHRRHDSRSPHDRRRESRDNRRDDRYKRPEVDEFGRVRPPPRSPSRSNSYRRSSSRSRERRKRERRERKQVKKEKVRTGGGGGDTNETDAEKEEREKAYRQSLWPPGADLAHYEFDPNRNWYVTPDRVWWYRPDLTLWYDCRNESFYSYDTAMSDYVSVEKDVATKALAEGTSCAPQQIAEAAAAEQALAVKQEEAQRQADAEAAERARLAAESEAQSKAEAASAAAADGEAVTQEEEDKLDAEDKVAEKLRAHTESWQGKKDSQEDRYIQGIRMGKLGTIFGMFDGHGGVQAAEYAGRHLPRNVLRCYQQREGKQGVVDHKKLHAAMDEAFPLTDKEMLSTFRRKSLTDGTTALICLLVGASVDTLTLFCSHVGDCRAVMCRGGKSLRLTQDHRPDRKDEQKRVKDAGGGVFQVAGIWRCTTAAGAARAMDPRAGFKDGESHLYLSCSRSLGDPELKLNADRPILSNQPETTKYELQAEDLFIILACDGVWDVISDQQAVDICLEHWGQPASAAAALVRTALSSGSGDNLTAQVIMFAWKADQGAVTAIQRFEQKQVEAAEAKKEKPKVKVVEEEIDMFA